MIEFLSERSDFLKNRLIYIIIEVQTPGGHPLVQPPEPLLAEQVPVSFSEVSDPAQLHPEERTPLDYWDLLEVPSLEHILCPEGNSR